MIIWILLAVYVLGVPCWIWMEKRFLPFQEGDYTIDFDGAHEITPEMWKSNVCARAFIWPVCIAFAVILLPVVAIDKLFDKL